MKIQSPVLTAQPIKYGLYTSHEIDKFCYNATNQIQSTGLYLHFFLKKGSFRIKILNIVKSEY